MRRTLVVTGLVASFVFGADALAQEPYMIGTQSGVAEAPVITTMPRQASADVSAAKEIVSTFNSDPNRAYNPTWGAVVGQINGFPQYMAVPFTPDKNYTVTTITFAISHNEGSNGVFVSLNADDNGLPGAEIRTATFTNFPWKREDPWKGVCCMTSSFRDIAVPVTAGKQYWVVAKTGGAYADAEMSWHINNIGAKGQQAHMWGSDQWKLNSPDNWVPAFSVEGTPAP